MTKGVLVAFLGSALLVGAAQAAPVSLGYLIDTNGTVTDGDLVFSNFAYLGTGSAPTAYDIGVLPFTNGAGDYGIQFSDSWTAVGNDYGDSAITYTVTSLGRWIEDAGAFSIGSALGGAAFWDVSETLTSGSSVIGNLTTYNIVGGGSQLSDHIYFAPVKSIVVVKDIGFAANGGLVDLSIVQQNFSQAVPEPSTWAMMLLGFAGLGFAGYRKAKTSAGLSAL